MYILLQNTHLNIVNLQKIVTLNSSFFEILCYEEFPSRFIWHIPCENRLLSDSENVSYTILRKVFVNYMICTMCKVWAFPNICYSGIEILMAFCLFFPLAWVYPWNATVFWARYGPIVNLQAYAVFSTAASSHFRGAWVKFLYGPVQRFPMSVEGRCVPGGPQQGDQTEVRRH